jgi:hypothetical protein
MELQNDACVYCDSNLLDDLKKTAKSGKFVGVVAKKYGNVVMKAPILAAVVESNQNNNNSNNNNNNNNNNKKKAPESTTFATSKCNKRQKK